MLPRTGRYDAVTPGHGATIVGKKARRRAQKQKAREDTARRHASMADERSDRTGVPGLAITDPQRLAARLSDVSGLVRRRLARSDVGDGMTRARLSALSLLLLGGPRTLGQLAAAEQVRPPTMTRLVSAMEAEGLVRRERNAADGRSIVVSATEAGARLCARGRQDQLRDLARLLAGLGADEGRAADVVLARLEDLLRQPETGTRD